MNTNPKNNDSLSLNFNVGGNSPPANLRYNGSPLAAFKMENLVHLSVGRAGFVVHLSVNR
ncbi:hypothetical protein MC7420_389 [Coleofasciculus chthonoplastes PCC 7420]|uniref:Uncharacterized protein n=1 Tax=Coleofasciculus chthonoplastes PCC 7420 TaxID=118168 RepID=B4VLS0_9CYAN|nr:hypothetical protein [Coleofasciculus chthonoplastes]EDX77252.1 hypothetical protein MC7420_389 [Coleofasciculus chthonoplastes PCC 7420]